MGGIKLISKLKELSTDGVSLFENVLLAFVSLNVVNMSIHLSPIFWSPAVLSQAISRTGLQGNPLLFKSRSGAFSGAFSCTF